MTSFDVPRNQVQQPADSLAPSETAIKTFFKRTVNTSTAIYDVPEFKSAKITGMSFNIEALGSSNRSGYGVQKGGTGSVVQLSIVTKELLTEIYCPDVILESKDILFSFSTNAATNSQMNFTLNATEFDP